MSDRERLLAIIEQENMTGKQFAEAVGIGAGTISNIASGRNNPSLDLLQRVHTRFPQYAASWLFEGKGEMKVEYAPSREEILAANAQPVSQTSLLQQQVMPEIKTTEDAKKQEQLDAAPVEKIVTKQIDRIVIFYTDGTFESR